MKKSTLDKGLFLLALASSAIVAPSPSAAFWQRSQVSMCADATSAQEHARHRCDELRAYADPGWPALGLGEAGGYRGYRRLVPDAGQAPAARPPVRRLG
ncbi:MAG: hypothetical protein DCF30_01185 [Hyphomicrobiales bacterium]|nr:MAG: hypothetical protein DCF30_01185 [Hyphomicrobiales bacterium]